MENREMTLKGKRIVLKAIEAKDKEEMISLLCDDRIKKTYVLSDLNTTIEKEALFSRLKNISEDISRFVYGIYLNDKIIGFLNECGREDDGVEIGYFIKPELWNNGYATEAFGLAIKELFRIGHKKVIAAHFEENIASGKVMQKCGLKLNGKVGEMQYRGQVRKLVYYSINNY